MTRFTTGRCLGLYKTAIVRDNVMDTETGEHAAFIVGDTARQSARVAKLLNDQPDLADTFVWHGPDVCEVIEHG